MQNVSGDSKRDPNDIDAFDQLIEWGWDDYWSGRAEEMEAGSAAVARVVGQDRASWTLQTGTGAIPGRLSPATEARVRPTVGDWVCYEPGPMPTDPASIMAAFPRKTAITRGSAGTGAREQVLAANVDVVWIVHGLDMEINARRIERYLTVAWESGATPAIVLTKADMADSVEDSVAQVQAIAMGVSVVAVSVFDRESVTALRGTLEPGRTVSLIGPSGAGKSTLINLLAGTDMASTGEVREKDHKGRHTTTRRELFRIPGGALLLDTPGLRELRIGEADEGLTRTFPDIEELAAHCRFRDCMHDTEPGCAVLQAVGDGRLEQARLDSFRKLQAEIAYETRRTDPRARAAAVAEWKSIMKSMKHHQKRKDQR